MCVCAGIMHALLIIRASKQLKVECYNVSTLVFIFVSFFFFKVLWLCQVFCGSQLILELFFPISLKDVTAIMVEISLVL